MKAQQNRRSRNRKNNNRKFVNPLVRNYESNGPNVKIRGNAQHIVEKYIALARDVRAFGDDVMAENYLQHAEHYNRLILSAQQHIAENAPKDILDDNEDVQAKTGQQPQYEAEEQNTFAQDAENALTQQEETSPKEANKKVRRHIQKKRAPLLKTSPIADTSSPVEEQDFTLAPPLS